MTARRAPRPRFASTARSSPTCSLAAKREEWLAHGLRAEPADRRVAEDAVTELFQLAGCRSSKFTWVPSPSAGAKLILAEDYPSEIASGYASSGSAVAHLITGSRRTIIDRIHGRRLSFGHVPRTDDRVLSTLAQPLRTSLIGGVAVAIRAQVGPMPGRVTWYGQQEAHHIAYFEALLDLGKIHLSPHERRILNLQARLARSTGWWWVTDDVCIMADRPTAVHSEPLPSAEHGQRRLHRADGPAIQFADGTDTSVLHGTVVPDWVIRDPTVDRIRTERNVEVRRAAIERLGWDRFIESAALRLIDRADDPGNTGHSLDLYGTPRDWRGGGRILLATNGSVERDGTRRRYGLAVPGHFSSALDAAGWTYGLRGTDYARLARRT